MQRSSLLISSLILLSAEGTGTEDGNPEMSVKDPYSPLIDVSNNRETSGEHICENVAHSIAVRT